MEKDSIIVQCPKCGQWVRIERQNFLQRVDDSFTESASKIYQFGEDLGLGRKGKKVLTFLAGGTYLPAIKALYNGATESPFHGFCPECNYEFAIEGEYADQSEEYEQWLEEIDPTNVIYRKFYDIELSDKNEALEYINEIEQQINEEDDNAKRSSLFDVLAASYYLTENNEKALQAINNSIQCYDSEDNYTTHALKGLIMGELDTDTNDYLSILQELVHYKQGRKFLKEKLYSERFDLYLFLYVDSFLEIPVGQRRFIMFCPEEEIKTFPKSFCLLPTSVIPKDLQIDGEIEEYALYIRHPFDPKKYLLASEYELLLFRDKANEFKHIMNSLGAEQIVFTDKYTKINNSSSDQDINVHIEGGKKQIASGQGTIHNHKNQKEEIEFLNQIQNTRRNSCNVELYPTLPQDIVWYHHEQEWQREVQARLDGITSEADFQICINKSMKVSSQKRTEIQADFENLIATVKGDVEVESVFNQEDTMSREWNFHVSFYPLSLYTNNDKQKIDKKISETKQTNKENNLRSANEKEYLDELKECMVDGELGSSERRLLNKLRDKLGISEERANELEASLSKPQLSEEEREYLEAYQDALEDGVISEKERRLLDKLMKINDISAERAKELEKL